MEGLVWKELLFSSQNIKEKLEVRAQAPQWILEGCGFIFLKEKVTHPGKTIADQRYANEAPPPLRHQGSDEHYKNEGCPDKMQQSTCAILMLGEVERVKFFKTLITLFHGSCFW